MAEFKRGRASCKDKHLSSQQNEATMTEMVKKIHKMVLDVPWLKVRELADMVGISKSAEYRILTENLSRGNYAQDGCRVCSQRNKNSFVRMFKSSVWRCFTAIMATFCVMSKSWTKHGSITSHLRRRNNQNNGLTGENGLERRRRQFHLLARSWHQF